jgi:hypothetical protein
MKIRYAAVGLLQSVNQSPCVSACIPSLQLPSHLTHLHRSLYQCYAITGYHNAEPSNFLQSLTDARTYKSWNGTSAIYGHEIMYGKFLGGEKNKTFEEVIISEFLRCQKRADRLQGRRVFNLLPSWQSAYLIKLRAALPHILCFMHHVWTVNTSKLWGYIQEIHPRHSFK